ncbi:hypothetical protein [Burkholderia ubonensis]|uniref:hypothetical protein n=1 Tax=Burkholderia ubonensis TaxID=101571 RepID=UPI0012F8A722|nr:hypothetical protein [Burkholderia ubonensis]
MRSSDETAAAAVRTQRVRVAQQMLQCNKNRRARRLSFDFRSSLRRAGSVAAMACMPVRARLVPSARVARRVRASGEPAVNVRGQACIGDAAPAQQRAGGGAGGRPQRLLPFDLRRHLKITI